MKMQRKAAGCMFVITSYSIHYTKLYEPQLTLHSPQTGEVVSAPQPIVITVEDASLVHWQLWAQARDRTEGQLLAEGTTPQSAATVASFDPSQLTNGMWYLGLKAVDANGAESETGVTVSVEGDLKVGNFSLTFEDLTVPLSGLPITLTRTYDSRERQTAGDFGQGWRLGYQSLRLHEAAKAGPHWKVSNEGGTLGQWCLDPVGERLVSVIV